MKEEILTGTRRNAAATATAAAALVVAYLLFPRPTVRYGAWLLIFSVWMLWFVLVVAGWLSGKSA